jgi:hypothetical protein
MSLVLGLIFACVACTSGIGDPASPSPTGTRSTYRYPSYSTTPATTTPPASTGSNVRPGEKPPTLAPEAGKNTPVAATLFAQYWMRTLDWGYATTDSSLAKRAFGMECRNCSKFMKVFDDTFARGEHFRGGRSTLKDVAIQPNDRHNGSSYVVDVTISQARLQVIDHAGDEVSSAPSIPHVVFRTWIAWRTGGWTIVDWQEVVDK